MSECENGHERTHDLTGLYNVPNSRQDFHNDGYAGQGSSHYHSNILNTLSSLKFSDRHMENMVLDFAGMDSHYLVKNVSDSIRFPFAMKAVGDSYISQ